MKKFSALMLGAAMVLGTAFAAQNTAKTTPTTTTTKAKKHSKKSKKSAKSSTAATSPKPAAAASK